MSESPPSESPQGGSTLPMPQELARQGGGEKFGRYQLGKRLGAGVSHDKWQAWDPEKQTWVALRVWPRPAPGEKERALSAGKSARAAADPRIVAPLGGGLECGQLWLARPYLEALPIRDVPWTDDATLAALSLEGARALAGAHGKGLAHGRVTAGNVLVESKEGPSGWRHKVWLTEFGLTDGDAAADARGLGRIFCELTGQPAPGGGATTKASPGASGDTTDLSKKGETTRSSADGQRPVDGALAGIFLRARDGQLTAAEMAGELEAWIARRAAKPKKKPPLLAAIVAAVALAAVALGAFALKGRGGASAEKALAESSAAESEGRLEAALGRASAAAAADPSNTRAAQAVARLQALLRKQREDLDAQLAEARSAKSLDAQVAAARDALRAAGQLAAADDAKRAEVDAALAKALSAIESALRARPGHPPALRLLEDAATLFQPGDLSHLPRGADGRAVTTPAILVRADVTAWVFSCWGPHGLAVKRAERSPESLQTALFPAPPPGASATSTLDPAAPGRLARAILEQGAGEAPTPAAAAWMSGLRALLTMDLAAAKKAVEAIRPAPDDPFAPDLEWLRGAIHPDGGQEPFKRAFNARPWDALFVASITADFRWRNLPRQARALITPAVELHPDCADLRLMRAWCSFDAGDATGALQDAAAAASLDAAALVLSSIVNRGIAHYEDAIRDASEAIDRDPSLVLALVVRAQAKTLLRDFKGALGDAEAAVALDPERLDALQIRAQCRSDVGDHAGALADCEKAIKLYPPMGETYRLRGWIHLHAGDNERALADAGEALDRTVSRPEGLVLRGFAKYNLRDFDGARADATEALRVAPGSAQAMVLLGLLEFDRAEYNAAREHCTEALRFMPALPEGLRLRTLLRALIEGDVEGAEGDATLVLLTYPRDTLILRIRAKARLLRGRLTSALEDCDATLAIEPRSVEALVIRARVRSALLQIGKGDPSQPLEDLERALSIAPRDLEALELKAAALSSKGRHREAADAMTKALDVKPGHAPFLVLRAAYRELAGDVDGAMADADAAIAAAPKSAAGFYRRSSLNARKGDLEQAMLDAVDGTRAEPANPQIWRQLGDVYRAKGSKDRALEAYRACVKRAAEGDPERALAEAAIRKLEGK